MRGRTCKGPMRYQNTEPKSRAHRSMNLCIVWDAPAVITSRNDGPKRAPEDLRHLSILIHAHTARPARHRHQAIICAATTQTISFIVDYITLSPCCRAPPSLFNLLPFSLSTGGSRDRLLMCKKKEFLNDSPKR